MKRVLIQLDDALAARLEAVAPAWSHRRSELIRPAIVRSLDEELEKRTRAAYERWPDEEPPFDPADWAPETDTVHPPKTRSAARRPRSRKTNRAPKRI